MTDDGAPTEISPLLHKSANSLPQPTDTPNGALPNGGSNKHHAAKDSKIGDQEQANDVSDGRERQYQGLPEVKKQLKYIVPAIAIGVYLAVLGNEQQQLNDIDILVGRRPDSHC